MRADQSEERLDEPFLGQRLDTLTVVEQYALSPTGRDAVVGVIGRGRA